MDNRRNYYHILHVQPNAPVEVIKASYRTQMHQLKHHPDLGGSEHDAAIINEAYATLSDSNKRAEYDVLYVKSESDENHQVSDHQASAERKTLRLIKKIPVCIFCGREQPHDNNTDTCLSCDSPSNLSTIHLQTNDATSRFLERKLHNEPVKYFTAENSPAQIGIVLNLSPTGLQFQLSEQLTDKQIIKLACEALTAIVRVKHCRQNEVDGLYEVGVEFLTSRFNQQCGTFFSAVVT